MEKENIFEGMGVAVKEKRVEVFQLGTGSLKERYFMQNGMLKILDNGDYELFSRESVNGTGEIAHILDYVKIDTSGGRETLYPNSREFFEAPGRHIKISDGVYIQRGEPVYTYQDSDKKSKIIQYLIDTKQLRINENNLEKYFNATLWGTELSLPKDGVVIIYSAKEEEKLVIDFNLVAKDVFNKDYKVIREADKA